MKKQNDKLKTLISEKQKYLKIYKDTHLLENQIFLIKKINKINNKILKLLENINDNILFLEAFQEYNIKKEEQNDDFDFEEDYFDLEEVEDDNSNLEEETNEEAKPLFDLENDKKFEENNTKIKDNSKIKSNTLNNTKYENIYIKISNNKNYLLLNKTKKFYLNIYKKYYEKECILNILLDIFENYLDKNINYKIFYNKNFSDKRDKNYIFEKYIEKNFNNITLYKEENLKIESFNTYKYQYYEYINIDNIKKDFLNFNNNFINNLQKQKAIFVDASIKKGKYCFLGIHDNVNNLKFSYKLPNNFIKDSNHLELFGYIYIIEKYKDKNKNIIIYGDNKHMIEKLQDHYLFEEDIIWIPRELNKEADNLANNSKITKKLDKNICEEVLELTNNIINKNIFNF